MGTNKDIRLTKGSNVVCNESPTLDRLIPEIGYVKNNIAIISNKANRIKNNGSSSDHRKIAEWMETQILK